MPLSEYESGFDETFRRKGGRFDVNAYDSKHGTDYQALFNEFADSAKENIATAQAYLTSSKMPYVHFDFINSPLFNATATVGTNYDYIGFNYGTILLLVDVFNRIMANPDTFPEIGYPDFEVPIEPLDFITANYAVIEEHYHNLNTNPVEPQDPIRKQHAGLLAHFAATFLLYHEIAHLKNGHVNYKGVITGEASFTEFNEGEKGNLPPLTNQVLEWSADSWATGSEVNRLKLTMKTSEAFSEIRDKYEIVESGVFYNWLFAIWVLFRLMDIVQTKVRPEGVSQYPSPMVRLHSIISTASISLVASRMRYDDKVIAQNFRKVVVDAERALNLLSNQKFEFEYAMKDVAADPYTTYINAYSDHLDEVYVDLRKYSYSEEGVFELTRDEHGNVSYTRVL